MLVVLQSAGLLYVAKGPVGRENQGINGTVFSVWIFHFGAKRVFQEVEAIPVLISASGKNIPNSQALDPSVLQTSSARC